MVNAAAHAASAASVEIRVVFQFISGSLSALFCAEISASRDEESAVFVCDVSQRRGYAHTSDDSILRIGVVNQKKQNGFRISEVFPASLCFQRL